MAKKTKKTRFGRYLEDLRLTYYRVASDTGINVQNIRNWATGKTRPRMDKYQNLRFYMREKHGLVLSTHDFETYGDDNI